jgi:hypothetical protein
MTPIQAKRQAIARARKIARERRQFETDAEHARVLGMSRQRYYQIKQRTK